VGGGQLDAVKPGPFGGTRLVILPSISPNRAVDRPGRLRGGLGGARTASVRRYGLVIAVLFVMAGLALRRARARFLPLRGALGYVGPVL